MPMVETSMAIRALETGEVLEIVATDPGTKTDIPAWCKRSGNVLLKSSEVDGVFRFYVRKQ
jgi:tRNA 2-thiouridine synthesizing protein A